ncbi:hypothetical protein PpBr36_02233 [Pyricularia pennisetigena]|uniref:hypothetical protein n=1 Tax=Pyricularia pennisetigena TaxID=1578925 RepID=UPI001152B6FE|nr:hypothetical protein PpBr36_02233 [Pyricularia pennisetigena]TLS30772.1 hypothetical protein PpBr36_02233 [Pyricularia pennisetigena]
MDSSLTCTYYKYWSNNPDVSLESGWTILEILLQTAFALPIMKLHMIAPLPDEDDSRFRSSRSAPKKPAHRDLRPARGILKKNSSGDVDETDRSSVLIPAFVAGAAVGYFLWRDDGWPQAAMKSELLSTTGAAGQEDVMHTSSHPVFVSLIFSASVSKPVKAIFSSQPRLPECNPETHDGPDKHQTAGLPPPSPHPTSESVRTTAGDCLANGIHGISPLRSRPTLLILQTTSRKTAAPHARQATARPRLMPMLAATSFSRRGAGHGAELGLLACSNVAAAVTLGRQRCILGDSFLLWPWGMGP